MAIDFTNTGNNTPPKYSFILVTENGTFRLSDAPLEWESIKIAWNRDKFYWGIITEFIVDNLTFIGKGKDVLKELYEQKALFAEAQLKVQYLDYNTRTYKDLPTTYKLDFNTYKYVKKTAGVQAVEIAALPVGTIADFQQRESTNVNLQNTETVGGYNILIKDHWTSLRKNLGFPEILGFRFADFLDTTTGLFSITGGAGGATDTFMVPETEVFSDFSETQSIVFTTGVANLYDRGCFYNSAQERELSITGTIDIFINNRIEGLLRFFFAVVNSDNSIASTVTLGSYAFTQGAKQMTIDQDITLSATQSVVIYGDAEVIPNRSFSFNFAGTELRIEETFVNTSAVTVEGWPIYEAMERNLQLILNKQYPFYSEFFGRADVYYNADGDQYASSNQLRFAHLLNGLCIRGMPIDDQANNVPVNFKALFKTVRAMYNVGLGFETVSGTMRARIENLSYFFADVEILDISGRIRPIEIEEEALPDFAFSELLTGYKKAEYEAANGRGEYNTKNERTSEIPGDNKYDNVAEYRADTRGITLLLEKPLAGNGTEDVKGDEDIFIVKSQSAAPLWNAEQEENVQIVGDTSLFQQGSLNLYYTPTRNLLRHNYIIAAGLQQALSGKLRFQAMDKLATLQTTDGSTVVTENQDIDAADLGDPLWKANKLIVECDFYEADYQSLLSNNKGYITLSDNKTGWILSLEWEMVKNKAKLELIERWV